MRANKIKYKRFWYQVKMYTRKAKLVQNIFETTLSKVLSAYQLRELININIHNRNPNKAINTAADVKETRLATEFINRSLRKKIMKRLQIRKIRFMMREIFVTHVEILNCSTYFRGQTSTYV